MECLIVSGEKVMVNNNNGVNQGFTLIELLVVMSVIAMLLTIALPKYFGSVDKSKDAILRQDLSIMRDAIDKFYGDTGKYPAALEDLATKRYLKAIPVDPITESAQMWIVIAPQDATKGGVFDVKSGSTLKSLDGSSYSDW
jgi:general secretion pathway protein G